LRADNHGHVALWTDALQLVFCDVSTPRARERRNAYDLRKSLLVQRGVPAESIRYLRDATTDWAKAGLFAA
jgi:hypothetical protein